MTQKEKARAYDEALKLARDYHEDKNCFEYLKGVLENIFPELIESGDEKIRKDLIEWIKEFPDSIWRGHYTKDVIAWLEKQGEQKDINPTLLEKEKMDNAFTKMMFKGKTALEAIHEEKFDNANKIEQKFNEGDWIIFNGWILHIDEVVNGYYRTTSIGGIHNSYDWNIDNAARLWTIQEANDGDVLAAGDWVFIFRKFHINGFPKCHCHYDLTLEEFKVDTDSYMVGGGDIYPATEEQRELLFQKMKEAGYVWDCENINVIRLEKQGE